MVRQTPLVALPPLRFPVTDKSFVSNFQQASFSILCNTLSMAYTEYNNRIFSFQRRSPINAAFRKGKVKQMPPSNKSRILQFGVSLKTHSKKNGVYWEKSRKRSYFVETNRIDLFQCNLTYFLSTKSYTTINKYISLFVPINAAPRTPKIK